MSTQSNAVFLSYRRDSAGIYALAIYQYLSALGIDVFYGPEDAPQAQFDTVILSQIDARPYFLLILTADALSNCDNPSDPLRCEIERALSTQRLIVPLYEHDFDFAGFDYCLPDTAYPITEGAQIELPTTTLAALQRVLDHVRTNYLRSDDIGCAEVSPTMVMQVARIKQKLNAAPPVTEAHLLAQGYLNRALVRNPIFGREGAIADLTKAIHLKPDYALAYYHRGNMRDREGDMDGAIADYTEVIGLKPDDADVYIARGLKRQIKGDVDGAILDYTDAIRIAPDDSDAYNYRALLRRNKGDLAGAITDYTEVIRRVPDFFFHYIKRGSLRALQGDLDGAIADLTEAIRLAPDEFSAYGIRGGLRDQQGDKEGAAADFQRALELNPSHSQAGAMRDYIAKHRQR